MYDVLDEVIVKFEDIGETEVIITDFEEEGRGYFWYRGIILSSPHRKIEVTFEDDMIVGLKQVVV